MKNNKIAFVLGTRPEIIKLSPVIKELARRTDDFIIIHSNQHYSSNLDEIFFKELDLPKADYNLNVSSEKKHGAMVGKMLIKLEDILIKEKPDWVVVQGDTNTVLAGALAASKLNIKIAHVEAGLRSYDRTMPEELNRVVTDHLSSVLFCPSQETYKIASGEGIDAERLIVTGNTIVDSIYQIKTLIKRVKLKTHIPGEYFLCTLHRPSNVDDKEVLSNIFKKLTALSRVYEIPIILPIHPRTENRLKEFKINLDKHHIILLPPAGYLEMLKLESQSKLILTDSGGIQEEACILRVPCVTLRKNTERPETIKVGANMLANADNLLEAVKTMLSKTRNWKNPFGDGKSSIKIINLIHKQKVE